MKLTTCSFIILFLSLLYSFLIPLFISSTALYTPPFVSYYTHFDLEKTPSDLGLDYEEVFITTTNSYQNFTLSAWWILPENSKPENSKTILAIHGVRNNRRTFLQHSKEFSKKGYSVLLFDCLYSGNTTTGFSSSLGSQETRDIIAMAKFAKEIKKSKHVIALGISNGASSSLKASLSPYIDMVISENAYSSLSNVLFYHTRRILAGRGGYKSLGFVGHYFSALLPKLVPRYLIDLSVLFIHIRTEGLLRVLTHHFLEPNENTTHLKDPGDIIEEIKKPILFIASKNDKIVPYFHTQKLHFRSQQSKNNRTELWTVDSNLHKSAFFTTSKQTFHKRVEEFIQKYL